MTEQEKDETLKILMAALAQLQIALLSHADHIEAVKETLFVLDANARRVFDERLALEVSKRQEQRDGLRSSIDSMPTPARTKLN